MAARALEVVSPVRTETVIGGTAKPESFGRLGDLGQRALEVLLDVDGQRLERRDVDDPGPALQVLTGLRERGRPGRWPSGSRPVSCRNQSGQL